MDPRLLMRKDPLVRKLPDLSLLPERRRREESRSPLLPLCLNATGTSLLRLLLLERLRGGLRVSLSSPELPLWPLNNSHMSA